MQIQHVLKAGALFLRAVSKTSVCKRRGVSAAVFNRITLQMVGWGTNGPARHHPELCSGIKDGCGCAHSEVNTLLNCRPTSQDFEQGCFMLLSRAPCVPCATAIANCGYVRHLYYIDESEPGPEGLAVLKSAGIGISRYTDGDESDVKLRETAVVDGPKLPEYWKREEPLADTMGFQKEMQNEPWSAPHVTKSGRPVDPGTGL